MTPAWKRYPKIEIAGIWERSKRANDQIVPTPVGKRPARLATFSDGAGAFPLRERSWAGQERYLPAWREPYPTGAGTICHLERSRHFGSGKAPLPLSSGNVPPPGGNVPGHFGNVTWNGIRHPKVRSCELRGRSDRVWLSIGYTCAAEHFLPPMPCVLRLLKPER